jgi:PAS domain S-box-containing protein
MPAREKRNGLPYLTDLTFQPGDLVFATDRRGRLVYWNNECERLFGRSSSEVIGHSFEVICRKERGSHPVDLQMVMSGRDFAGDVRCLNKAGTEVALYLFATVGRNQAGKTAGVVFAGRDVTGLWHAEEVIRASAEKYRLLFENTTDSVAIADIEGRVIEVNPACLRMYGYSAEEVGQMNLVDIVAPESRAEAAAAMADLAVGKTVTKTVNARRKDGTRIVVDLVASVVPVGNEQRIYSVTRDVTARAMAEKATKASADKYRAIFESVADAVFLETLDGRILEANDNACRLLGYAREELLALKVADLVPGDARAWLPSVNDTIMRTGRFRSEAVNVRKDGSVVPVEISAATVEFDGQTRVILIARDISERKAAERALQESERQYHTALDAMHDAVHVADADLRIVMLNDAFQRWLGEQGIEGAVQGKTIFEAFPFLPDKVRDEYREVFETGRPVVTEEETTVAGRTYVTETTKVPVTEDETIVRVLTVVRNVTERRAAEQALRESEEKFRSVSEQSPNMIFINSRGRVAYANHRCEELMGYSREEFYAPGFDFANLTAPESAGTIGTVFGRHARGEDVEPYECVLVAKNGRRIDAIITTKLVDYEGGKAILGIVTDISERKASERALRESEANFRALAENAGDGVTIGDENGRHVFVNRRAEEILGYPRERLLGMTFRDFLSPPDRELLDERYERRLRGEPVPSHYEVTVVRRDGTPALVEVGVAQTEWRGRPAALVILRDVAERRRVEQALSASDARYRSLVESIPDGVTTIDVYGRFSSVNDVVVRRSGRPREWWLGREYDSVVRPEFRETVRAAFSAVMRGEAVPPFQVSYASAAGEPKYVEMHVSALSEGGRVVGALAVSRDITERKAVERQDGESEEKYRRLVELAPDGIAVHQDGKVVMVNMAGARIMGYESPEDIVGKPVLDIVHPDDRARVIARIRSVMESGKPGEMVEERFVRRDGSLVPVEVVNAPFVWNGRPAIQVVARDISERRRLASTARTAADELHAVLDHSSEAIAAESEGVLVYANRHFAGLLGYDSPEQIIGRPAGEFEASEDRAMLAEYSRMRERGEDAPARYAYRGLKRDGTTVPMEAVVSTYRSQDRLHILAFVRVIHLGRSAD